MDYKITRIKFIKPARFEPNREIVAFVELTIDDCIVIRGIELLFSEKNQDFYITYPEQYKRERNVFFTVFFPLGKDNINFILNRVIEEYKKWIIQE